MNKPAPTGMRAASALRIDGRAFIGGRVASCQRRDLRQDLADRRPHFGKHRPRRATRTSTPRWPRRAPPSPTRAGPTRRPPRKKVLQRFAEKILAAATNSPCSRRWTWASPSSTALAVDVGATARTIAWYAEAWTDLRRDRTDGGLGAGPDHARADGRDRRGGALELPDDRMAAWKLGPALAAGNSVVLKPSEKSPLTRSAPGRAGHRGQPARRRIQRRARLRPRGRRRALALHMDVDAIGFTGSTRVGRKMLEYAGRSNLKRVYNELGGKSAFVVFDDFAHVERAPRPWPAACSSTRARAATRPRACWCTRRWRIVSSSDRRRGAKYAPAIRSRATPRWARWSTRRR